MDAFTATTARPDRLPRNVRMLLAAYEAGKFPKTFLDHLDADGEALLERFLGMFEGYLSERTRDRLTQFLRTGEIGARIRAGLEAAKRERDELQRRIRYLKTKHKEIEEDPDKMLAEERERVSREIDLEAYAKLPKAVQKKVREFTTKFQTDPTSKGINYEPIHDAKDPKVRTVRIGADYRAIVIHPLEGNTYLLASVDHHDEAMAWIRNRTFDIHPVTGALQIVNVTETEAAVPLPPPERRREPGMFDHVSDDALLAFGVPGPLMPRVRNLRSETDLEKQRTSASPGRCWYGQDSGADASGTRAGEECLQGLCRPCLGDNVHPQSRLRDRRQPEDALWRRAQPDRGVACGCARGVHPAGARRHLHARQSGAPRRVLGVSGRSGGRSEAAGGILSRGVESRGRRGRSRRDHASSEGTRVPERHHRRRE
jgi:hypothetical protein